MNYPFENAKIVVVKMLDHDDNVSDTSNGEHGPTNALNWPLFTRDILVCREVGVIVRHMFGTPIVDVPAGVI